MNSFKAVCVAPSVNYAWAVKVRLSLNNQEYTDDEIIYHYSETTTWVEADKESMDYKSLSWIFSKEDS